MKIRLLASAAVLMVSTQLLSQTKSNQNSDKMNTTTEHYTFELSEKVTREK